MMPEVPAAAVVELVGVAVFKGAIGSAPAESQRATLSVDASETRAAEAMLSPATRPVSEMTAGCNRPVATNFRAVLASSSANASAPTTRYTLLSKSESSVAEVEGNAWANVSR